MPTTRQSTLALFWRFAALHVAVKLARLDHAVRKAGFNPSQPRAPAGSPIGGQWVAAGTSGDRIHVAVSAFDNPGLYSVDLAKEELKGGHGFSKHVARSDTQLIAYQWQQRLERPDSRHPAEGSFNSLGEANNLVSQVLRLNAETVHQVINGRLPGATLLHRFGFPTGREAFSPDDISPFVIRPTFWIEVLIRRHQSPPGYVVLTAYPRNETPNEEFAR
ncbi:RNase A-like domain-containing protein [Devosia sp.]|uniref:RNase A-like domain-containing protein n=1 Tax=Devosia sp. TaxID=1871048 RepID=UPI002B0033E1|nr:RNase A-like domain-containing protein [Devosia sp.]